MRNDLKISFIGGGNMATALIGGLLGKGSEPDNIHVVDVNPAALAALKQDFGVSTANRIDGLVARSGVIVLAVKPQQMKDVATALLPVSASQLILSIAAGIRATDLARWLNGHAGIVRCMPNTPALIGQGIAGMVALGGVTQPQRDVADAIMRSVGATVWLDDESLIDAVTAVSGSGPAYVFYFIEAMQQAALEMGLNSEQGKQLAIATFVGASQLAAQASEPVSVLRERVTSKGGTTFAALASMDASGVKQGIVRALQAAAARGKELGEEFGR